MIAAATLAAAAGCASGPKKQAALAPPAVKARVYNYVGTPLSGALATDVTSIKPGDSLSARVSFFSFEKMPATGFELLGPRVRLMVATREGMPVIPTGRLMLGVHFAQVDHAAAMADKLKDGKFGRSALICTQDGALLRGATASFMIEEQQGQPDVIPGQIVARRVALELYRPMSQASDATDAHQHSHVEICLAVDDFVNPTSPQDFGGAFAPRRLPSAGGRGVSGPVVATQPAEVPIYQSEEALFTLPAEQNTFALFIPIRLQGSDAEAVVAVVDISPSSAGKAHQEVVARTIDDLTNSSQAVAAEVKPVGRDPADWPGLSTTIESLAWASRQRAGLAYLAAQTDASITQDVALAASETILSRLADDVTREMNVAGAARDRKSIGWLLEHSTLRLLLQLQSSGKLPPELSAILALRAGEAGRHSDTLEEVISAATGQQDLQNRLAAENYIFLEDSSPASRVRAYDWLAARQLAPAGFDPLGSPKQRRAALEQAEDAAATQSSAP